MALPNAISAMLIYRLISWLLIAAIGWVVFFFVFRTEKVADANSGDDAPTDPGLKPISEAQLASFGDIRDPAEDALQGPLPPPDQGPDHSPRR